MWRKKKVDSRTRRQNISKEFEQTKELGADPKAIQQIELVGQLKNTADAIGASEFIFVLTILHKKNQRNSKKSFSRSVTVL